MMHAIGYASAVFMGFALGLMGSGGTLMTVPILVYLFGMDPLQATGYSLFVVGVSACFGALSYLRRGELNYQLTWLFVIPSFSAVYATRHWILPKLPVVIATFKDHDLTYGIAFALTLVIGVLAAAFILWRFLSAPTPKPLQPEISDVDLKREYSVVKLALLMMPAATVVFLIRQWLIPVLPYHLVEFHGLVLTRDKAVMFLFALVMACASYLMLMRSTSHPKKNLPRFGWALSSALIVIQGLAVGAMTGLLGAGGGFLIVPALVLWAEVPIKKAVGTSLLIITVNSLIGFVADVFTRSMDWHFLFTFTGLSMAGIFMGTTLAVKIPATQLKRSFGIFMAILSLVVVIAEIRS